MAKTKIKDSVDPAKSAIASRLREARNARELSQTALAKKAGLSRSAIVHYENANAIPGGLELLKLAQALAVSPNRILTGSSDFEESDAVEQVLTEDDETVRIVRTVLLMQSLDCQTRERLSELIVDIVRQRKTDSEFRALLEMLDLLQEEFVGALKGDIENLVEAVDLEEMNEKAEEIVERANRDK